MTASSSKRTTSSRGGFGRKRRRRSRRDRRRRRRQTTTRHLSSLSRKRTNIGKNRISLSRDLYLYADTNSERDAPHTNSFKRTKRFAVVSFFSYRKDASSLGLSLSLSLVRSCKCVSVAHLCARAIFSKDDDTLVLFRVLDKTLKYKSRV
jgi:hypothetical protein